MQGSARTLVRITVMKYFLFVLLPLGLLATIGCSRAPVVTLKWEQLIRELASYDHLPVLDDRNIVMYASTDPSGGNDDFNNFYGPGTEPGWVTLVDLTGPGCIRRFWMTGTDPGHPVRIYIDGEKKPSIEAPIDDLFGLTAPWTPPLAQYVNMCYYSYIPIPYQKSIRIETREPNVHPFWGPRRIFFQIAAETFAPNIRVESYPQTFSESQRTAAQETAAAWANALENRTIPFPADTPVQFIAPGTRTTLLALNGAGTLREWRIHAAPDDSAAWSRVAQEDLWQDLVVRVYYDNQTFPSIEAPLGSFFANAWRKRAYGAWWFTSSEDGFACRLPMPFASALRLEIENGADLPVKIRLHGITSPDRPAGAGYLHSEFRRSGPATGQPHIITRINGRGKFLGCFLGVTGLDQSWWILEGDERMWVDGQTRPVWEGTGLEDYFNGGWYYRGSVFGALNASFERAPFRVAQFRHQHPDPVAFQRSFAMDFERMNDERTGQPVKGWFDSVAYFYLENPSAVHPLDPDRLARRAVAHPNDQATLMLQLTELERANDFHGAMRLVEEHLERYPSTPPAEQGVLALRRIEYRRFLGEPITEEQYAPFLNGEHGEEAQRQASQLLWFYASENRALAGLNVNGRGRLWINNTLALSGDHPFNLFVTGVELTNGTQRLAMQVEMVRGEPWVQVGVRMHGGLAGTGPGTWCSRFADAGWRQVSPAAASWSQIQLRDVPRGVPDAPFIGGIPNAFILLQSKSYPVRGLDWGYHQGTYSFIQDFAFPAKGWPAFSQIMTGLSW